MTPNIDDAPYRHYTDTDINNIPTTEVCYRGKNLLKTIQSFDRENRTGCWANIETLAKRTGESTNCIRNLVHRLHKKGYIAIIGVVKFGKRDKPQRRVMITGGLTQTAEPTFISAAEILNAGPCAGNVYKGVKFGSVRSVHVPEVEELRQLRASACPDAESQPESTLTPPARGAESPRERIEKRKKENPPSAGSLQSSFSKPQTVLVVSAVTDQEETKDTVPAVTDQEADSVDGLDSGVENEVEVTAFPATKESHKRKDWTGLVMEQVFAKVLKERFPLFSDEEARKILNLVNNKKVSPLVVGHTLTHLNLLQRESDEFKVPDRPVTLAGFCAQFFEVVEVIARRVKDKAETETFCELQEFNACPVEAFNYSKRHWAKYPDLTVAQWLSDPESRSYDLWPDLVMLYSKERQDASTWLSGLDVTVRNALMHKIGTQASGVKQACQDMGFDFKLVFGCDYAEAAKVGFLRKMELLTIKRRLEDPSCWQAAA